VISKSERKEKLPVDKTRLGSWEEVLAYAANIGNAPHGDATKHPVLNTKSVSCNAAWGSRIETTLLEDLSEDERCSLAEHIAICSACAARIHGYQKIDEFAKRLPYHKIAGAPAPSEMLSAIAYQHKRQESYERQNNRVQRLLAVPLTGLASCASICFLIGRQAMLAIRESGSAASIILAKIVARKPNRS